MSSTERLPTLTREEEERIIRLKKLVLGLFRKSMTSMKPLLPAALLGQSLNNFYARYEDDTEKANDKKAAQLRNKVKALTLVVR